MTLPGIIFNDRETYFTVIIFFNVFKMPPRKKQSRPLFQHKILQCLSMLKHPLCWPSEGYSTLWMLCTTVPSCRQLPTFLSTASPIESAVLYIEQIHYPASLEGAKTVRRGWSTVRQEKWRREKWREKAEEKKQKEKGWGLKMEKTEHNIGVRLDSHVMSCHHKYEYIHWYFI